MGMTWDIQEYMGFMVQDTRLIKKYLSFGTLPRLTLSVFSLGAEVYAGLLSITEELVIAYLA